MGESDEDLVDLAFALRDLNPDSIPLNMLHPVVRYAIRREARIDTSSVPQNSVPVSASFTPAEKFGRPEDVNGIFVPCNRWLSMSQIPSLSTDI